MTTSIVLGILLLYGAGMYWIGQRAKRRASSFQDAIAAPGQTTTLLLAGSAIGGQIGSGFVIGGAEYGARFGISGAWYGIGCGLSYLVTVLLARFIHEHQFVSLSDYFAQRYQGSATRLIYSTAGIFSCIALLAGQLLAGQTIFLTLGLPARWGMVLTAVIALVYANMAGLWGSMAVSAIQSTTIFTGMSAALFVMLSMPGAKELVAQMPPASFRLFEGGGEFIFSMGGPIVLAGTVNQIAFQSVTSAKSVKTAQGGYLLAGLLLIPIAFIPPLLGMFGRAMFPELPAEQVFTALLLTRLPTAVAAMILAAIICAVVSSCNSAYIAVAANAIHDIYQGMINPQADSRTCRKMMVWVDAAVCVVGLLLAMWMNDIIQVLSMGYSLIAAGCLVPFLGGVLWKGGTSQGALASAFVGMGSYLISAFGIVPLPYDSLSCIGLSAVTYVVCSSLRKEPD